MIGLIIGVLGGIIALTPAIVSRRPDAAQMLGKLTPWTGWIGASENSTGSTRPEAASARTSSAV